MVDPVGAIPIRCCCRPPCHLLRLHCYFRAAVINRPFTYLLVPFLVLAVYQLAFFLSEHHSSHPLWQQHGAKAYQWLLQRKQQALQVTAQVEIMNGFTLLALLLTPGRQPVLMLMVWQVLRLRYWSVDAAIHHRQVRFTSQRGLTELRSLTTMVWPAPAAAAAASRRLHA